MNMAKLTLVSEEETWNIQFKMSLSISLFGLNVFRNRKWKKNYENLSGYKRKWVKFSLSNFAIVRIFLLHNIYQNDTWFSMRSSHGFSRSEEFHFSISVVIRLRINKCRFWRKHWTFWNGLSNYKTNVVWTTWVFKIKIVQCLLCNFA